MTNYWWIKFREAGRDGLLLRCFRLKVPTYYDAQPSSYILILDIPIDQGTKGLYSVIYMKEGKE